MKKLITTKSLDLTENGCIKTIPYNYLYHKYPELSELFRLTLKTGKVRVEVLSKKNHIVIANMN